MPPEYINEAEVDRRLDRLQERYVAFPVVEKRESLSQAQYERWTADVDAYDYIGGAYCWIRRDEDEAPALSESMPEEAADDGDRVLLIMGRGTSHWGVPGGGIEDGEISEEAAEREVREEVDIDCSVSDVLFAERVIGTHESTGSEVHLLYTFFEADYVEGEVAIQSSELNGACWFRELPDDLHPAIEDRAHDWP
ncbi:NUDIX domain-containing protein [Haloarchaeobius litoreus]|uniref:NUDIX domain-containing protein n=1 Tax=Haloarchaeobius litoreus TaxID=755306 RepID=A0ABD6DE83_9EURY|nr:NUDIX domain-containing protein [Haloarchaeobius litoreus]